MTSWRQALRRATVSRVTWVIAHRGASGDEQENTLPAFERAIELGADYVEFDVQAASDGGLVVFHDLTLDRLTAGRGPLRARPLAELRELGIPTLEEVLELTAGRIGVMAELKSPWLYRRHDIVARTVRAAPGRRRSSSRSRAARSSRRAGCGPALAHRAARRLRHVDPRRGRLRLGRGLRRRPCDRARNREGPGARPASARLHGQRADAPARAAGARRRRGLYRLSGSERGQHWLVGQAEQARAVRREARDHLRADRERRGARRSRCRR